MNLLKALPCAAALIAGFGGVTSASATWTLPLTGSPTISTAAINPNAVGSQATLNSVTGAYAANGGQSGATNVNCGSALTIRSSCGDYGISGFASAGTAWTTGNDNARLQGYSGGIGMASDSTLGIAPNHAIDNGPKTDGSDKVSGLGNTEAVLLNFSSSVVLTSIGIGWKGYTGNDGDADISLFRWTGVNGPTASLNGVTSNLTGMQSAGWELVGNYGDLTVDTSNPYNCVNGTTAASNCTTSATSKGSSWWLISAYNSNYGAATSGTVNQGNDYFKIYAIAGSACTSTDLNCGRTPPQNQTVPEPGSLALVAIAGLGAIGARRRRRATVSSA